MGLEDFKVTQRNLHHSKLATDILDSEFTRDKIGIALVQEPLAHNFKVRGLSGKQLIFDSKVK